MHTATPERLRTHTCDRQHFQVTSTTHITHNERCTDNNTHGRVASTSECFFVSARNHCPPRAGSISSACSSACSCIASSSSLCGAGAASPGPFAAVFAASGSVGLGGSSSPAASSSLLESVASPSSSFTAGAAKTSNTFSKAALTRFVWRSKVSFDCCSTCTRSASFFWSSARSLSFSARDLFRSARNRSASSLSVFYLEELTLVKSRRPTHPPTRFNITPPGSPPPPPARPPTYAPAHQPTHPPNVLC